MSDNAAGSSMHPVLLDTLSQLQTRFFADERCLAMQLSGSLGQQAADAFSDVDVTLIVREADYTAFKTELYSICESIFGKIPVWLPEGESADYVNYAFLFEAGEDLLLYDISLLTDAGLSRRSRFRPERVLFDRAGLLAEKAGDPVYYSADHLMQSIRNYWVYMYLNGKYHRRSDLYKLLYVQGVLFHHHLSLLHSFFPEEEWHWWARDVSRLTPDKRRELLVYFGATCSEEIARALWREMDCFSQDARAACQRWQAEYPMALEQGVRQHLERMIGYQPERSGAQGANLTPPSPPSRSGKGGAPMSRGTLFGHPLPETGRGPGG